MDKIYELIQQWIDDKRIPDAVLQINLEDKVIAQKAFGSAKLHTRFDAASLTKVAATLPSLLLLEQAGKLSLHDTLSTYIPDFQHTEVTLLHCLLHRTGLPGSLPYPQNRYSTNDVWQEIFTQPLIANPGEKMQYSDLGMTLAGLVVEKVAEQSLAVFAAKHIFEPLGMKHTQFNPDKQQLNHIAPTEWDEQRQVYLHGQVHDEICYRLGGVSGSAGLFTTAEDLSLYARAWLNADSSPIFTPQTVKKCITQPVESRGLGWQVQDFTASLACGASWPYGSFGHTGFTGTSLWLEPSIKLLVVFLTNAVHYGRSMNIIELRKQLHTAIYNEIN